jgi:hypothetical protein
MTNYISGPLIWTITIPGTSTDYTGNVIPGLTSGSVYMATSVGIYTTNNCVGETSTGFVMGGGFIRQPSVHGWGLTYYNGEISEQRWSTSANCPYVETLDGIHARVFFIAPANPVYVDIGDYINAGWRTDNEGALTINVYEAIMSGSASGSTVLTAASSADIQWWN